jgi:hypothetical protein
VHGLAAHPAERRIANTVTCQGVTSSGRSRQTVQITYLCALAVR